MQIKKKKGLDGKLDDAWRDLVKLRAGMKCEYSGKKRQQLHSHHIFTREKKSTRWDLDNGICLTANHHVLSSKFSAHKTPLDFFEWLEEYRGKQFVDDLRLKSNQIKHWTIQEKEELLEKYRKEIKKLKENLLN